MKAKKQILCLCEGAMMVALAWAVDVLCAMIPSPFAYGGRVSVGALPIVYFSFRRGAGWGAGAGLVFGVIQLIMGWSAPPAGTAGAVLLCVLLDYIAAFTVIGLADLIAKPFGRHRLAGYGSATLCVSLFRFLCSFLSGVLIWDAYAPEGMNVWLYSLIYNGGYMLPNALLTALLTVILCRVLDPHTLKPIK